jgi:SAM-dependent methyltransferase
MNARDVFLAVDDLDAATIERLAARLEFRGRDPLFTRWRDEYLDRLDLPLDARVLELGCGTGVVTRALAARPGFAGEIVGQDPSRQLLAMARRLAAEAGDATALSYPDRSFDAVIAHTTISHVADPLALLREAARVARPDGRIAIFDGDYASWTFDHPDPALAEAMEEGIITAVIAQPRVLRELPRLSAQADLRLETVLAWVYADVGQGVFFPSAVDTYAPLVARAGLVPPEQVDAWVADQHAAMERRIFFAACNYYAYLLVRAS